MQSFKKLIAIDGADHEFLFNRIFTANGIKYHVSVFDTNRQPFFFNMEEIDSAFQIINAPKLPEWIMAQERQLQNAIFESLIEESTD